MIIVFLAYKLLKIDYKIVWFNIAFRILKNYFIYHRKSLGDILGSLGKTTLVKRSIF